jgi:AICAR transformylase/IMP cyclohydrolase PurH
LTSCIGKQLSYNNLVDRTPPWSLMAEFAEGQPACAIQHIIACGVPSGHIPARRLRECAQLRPDFGVWRRHHRE